MTREEAISVLKETIDPNIDKSFKEWKEWDKEKHLPAVNMAIEALKEKAMTRDEATQELVEWIKQMEDHGVPNYSTRYEALKLAIKTLQAEPKRGKWTITETYDCEGGEIPHLICSECRSEPMAWSSKRFFNYCPNCGAKMDKD